jgi:S-adenosyl-L-methionine hydrolase (adenosine-forming)
VPRVVTLLSDFGLRDEYAGVMEAAIVRAVPDARVVHLTHGIEPQAVLQGALALAHALPYAPVGVHVAVVDPGVGTARRPLCVETDHGVLVGPDNGLLSLAAGPTDVRRIVHLTDERLFLSPRSGTFDGRDVFAPVAAALVAGTPPRALGAEVPEMERLALREPLRRGRTIEGEVVYVDHFGNLITNVAGGMMGRDAGIRIGETRLRGPAPSYAAVPPGELVAVVGSWGLLEIAVRNGSASARLGASKGERVVVDDAA